MQTTTASFVVDVTPGAASVIIDDRDVTSEIEGLTLEAHANDLPVLTLYAHRVGVIRGAGIVEVVTGAATGDSVRALDPDEVKRRAVHGLDMGSDFTGAVLAVVAQMLDEQAG